MAIQPLNTIKGWFETGDKPTQNQFWDWLDSFRHKSDAIPMADVSGLDVALSGFASQGSVDALKAISLSVLSPTTSASQNIPAGTIIGKLRVKSSSAITFNLGTSVGGTQILNGESLGANEVGIYQLDFDCETLTTIHFSALAGNTNIKIFLLQ